MTSEWQALNAFLQSLPTLFRLATNNVSVGRMAACKRLPPSFGHQYANDRGIDTTTSINSFSHLEQQLRRRPDLIVSLENSTWFALQRF